MEHFVGIYQKLYIPDRNCSIKFNFGLVYYSKYKYIEPLFSQSIPPFKLCILFKDSKIIFNIFCLLELLNKEDVMGQNNW